MRKIAGVFFVLVIFAGMILTAEVQEDILIVKLKVNVSVGNVREKPSTDSKIITQVTEGTLLDAVGKEGNWYLVIIPQHGIEPELKGYIHRSIVDVVGETKPKISPKEAVKEEIPVKKESPKKTMPQVKAPEYQEKMTRKKIYIRANYSMGFAEETIDLPWSQDIYYETASAGINYSLQKGSPINLAVGYMFTDSLGVELGADISSRNLDGNYSASIPHPLLFETYRYGEGTGSYKVSENSVFLNFVYSLRFNKFGLDLFAGPAYILSTANIITEMNYSESYPYDSISLSVNSTEVSKEVFGFNGGANVLFYFGNSFAVYVSGHYIGGKADFETGTDIPGPQFNLGGFKAGAGLKFFF